ncbi:hypothetical protein IEC97_19690 [Neobacillus cucumis]|uniref:hypothetical protein n=1 Tax=Neobacillus cucumis TaxID=1740721 RepID=UPI0018DFBDD0|nr:hypothetical protein [Neobacillus cucumis]MBI0579588.1 hypothetical protein [Neobacillus cucumis]
MIGYLGSIRKFDHFNNETPVQNVNNGIDTIGYWFTSDLQSAKPYAMGTETIIQKSDMEFWEDGEPKVVQFERPVRGFIYKVYVDEPNLKEYKSNSEDSYDLFMKERDKYCDYLGAKKAWEDQAILLNKEEANSEFRNSLMKIGFEGFVLRNSEQQNGVTDLYCLFSQEPLHITDVIPIDDLE